MARTLKTLLDGLAFPEGPRWRDGRLWFSDMHAHEVVAMAPDGSRETVFARAGPVVGPRLAAGRADAGGVDERSPAAAHRPGRDRGQPTRTCRASPPATATTWWSTRPAAPTSATSATAIPAATSSRRGWRGSIRTARSRVAADELIFPNGTVITPDGKTLIVGETFAARMTAFDIAADGALSNRRVWAALPQGAVPDGFCLDAEGAIWVASPTSNDVIRLAEGGEVKERITADQGVYACMLGGADGKTLYLLTAASSVPAECAANRTGRIEAVRVDVAGAGLP